MLVAAILKQKPPGFFSVSPGLTVAGVAAVLAEKNIGAVLVLDGDRLSGILSERDIVRAMARQGAAALDLPASALMTRKLVTGTPDTSIEQAMEMMTSGHFRHLPILAEGRLIGLVSIGDVVKARIEQSQHEVESLRTYVTGSAPRL